MVLLIAETFRRILEILLVPYYNNEVIWIIAPLLFVLMMIQMYFGRYKTEQLGWNTAFSNTASLMWVTVILFKFLHDKFGSIGAAWLTPGATGDVVIVTLLGILTLTLAILDFYHVLPKKFAFLISSTLPLNAMAFFTALIVVGNITFDRTTSQAFTVLLIFFIAVFYIYKKMITPAPTIVKTLEKREKEKEKLIRKEERKVKKVSVNIWIRLKYWIVDFFDRRRLNYKPFREQQLAKMKREALKKEIEEKKKVERKKKAKKD